MATYTPISFAPIIYPAWGKLFEKLPDSQKAEILMAITNYPDYEPKEDNFAWPFIKGEIEKQFERFLDRTQKARDARNASRPKQTADDRGRPQSTVVDERRPTSTMVDHKPEPIPEPEPELESEIDIHTHSAEPSACVSSGIVSQIVDIYKEIAEGHFIQLRALTDKRKKAVKQFVEFLREQTKATEDDALLSEVRSYFLRASSCDFLCGKNDSGWRADFDFLTNKNKAVFVLEGKYDNKDERTAEQKAHDDYWKIKPVHDWQAEQEAYIKAKREQEEKEGLHHAEAIQRYLNGERA